jgi:hypothetical protein
MIKDFTFFNKEVSIPVNLEYPVDLTKNADRSLVQKYVNSPSKNGIRWKNKGQEIVIEDPSASVRGFPSTDLLYVVAVYYGLNGKYKPPANALIYTLDGKIHKILEIPALISDNITRLLQASKSPNPPVNFAGYEGGLEFNGFAWRKNPAGELVNSISILYDREWWESRTLDPESGEIGGCINSGRL